MTDKTDREIMQQALNDLEALVAYIKGGEPDLFMQVPSIEALRERLAQQEQERREWKRLTDEEISEINKSIPGGTEVNLAKRLFAREIEAKLKEKND